MMPFETLTPFAEIAFLLALAAAVGLAGTVLRQPLIVSFIAVGLLAGPSALDAVHAGEQIDLLAELGIALLLFLVGIKLDVKLIRSLGAVSLMTGLGQVFFTSIGGYVIGLILGLDHLTSLYVAVALTFSSTIIVVKLLSDKREIDSLHGQIALGFLIVQDLVVVIAMIVLAAIGIGKAGSGSEPASVISVLASGIAMVAAVMLFVRYVATPITESLARTPELLLVFTIALATIFAAIGEHLGLGKEVGGLLAGVSLASTPYREAIAARLAPLRDFLLLFFFIGLGSTLDLSLLGGQLLAASVLSVFVLVGNPLIVLGIMTAMGYGRRTGFLAGLTVAQISEFSLIFTAMGVTLGHIGQEALGLVTMVGLVTIAASTYMITYSHQLYAFFEPALARLGRRRLARDATGPSGNTVNDVVLFGLGRFGTAIGLRLEMQGLKVLGVDFNPAAVRRWRELGMDAQFGDVTDADFVSELPLRNAIWLIVSIPQQALGVSHSDPRLAMLQTIREAGFAGRIAVTSHMPGEDEELRAAGADLVLEPFQDSADRAVDLVCGGAAPRRTPIPAIVGEGPAIA